MESVKLASGYSGEMLRPWGLSMLKNYALWVKDNQKSAPFHYDEISVFYNRINNAPCMEKGDDHELSQMISHLNHLSEVIRSMLINNEVFLP